MANSLSVLKMASVGCYWERCKTPQMCLIIPNLTTQGKYSPDPFCWSVYVTEHMGWWPLQHSFASVDNVTTDLFYCPINTVSSLEIICIHSVWIQYLFSSVIILHINWISLNPIESEWILANYCKNDLSFKAGKLLESDWDQIHIPNPLSSPDPVLPQLVHF